MDVTQDEKDRGILIVTSMTLDDFMHVIDAKISEMNDKIKLYIEECTEDYSHCKSATPHEVATAVELHKAYVAGLKSILTDLKEICKSNLHKDYMVPDLLVESFMEVSRRATALKYIKMQPSHNRIS